MGQQAELQRWAPTWWMVGLLVVTAPSTLRFADRAYLNVIGFSDDGRYLAFEQYGVIEAEPASWAEIALVDVDRNAWVIRPVRATSRHLHGDRLRAKVRRQAQPALDSLGIVPGNTGQLVLSHRFTDTGVDPHRAQFVIGAPPSIGTFFEQFDLELTERSADSTCGYFGEAKIFHLVLDPARGNSIVLQEDTRLPPSRGCALGYRIQDVYVYERHIAVFLNVMQPGFEGQNMRYLVVTGSLDQS